MHLTIPDIHGDINYLSNIYTDYNEFIKTLHKKKKDWKYIINLSVYIC